MKRAVIKLLKSGRTSSRKPLSECVKFWYPLRGVVMVNQKGKIVANDNPFWSDENQQNRKELIWDIESIQKKNIMDRSYFHMINRYENGDAYGIAK